MPQSAPPDNRCGGVIWFTGLSGAGKTTVALAVERELGRRGVRTECLDGDAVRALLPAGFGRAERDAHVKRVGFLASRLEYHGITVLCALISPYAAARESVRAMCRRFIEVYVSTPLATCEYRDVKGLYAKARRGELKGFTGLDDPYEPPSRPDLTLDTTELGLRESVQLVVKTWERVVRPTQFVDEEHPLASPACGDADFEQGISGVRR